VRKITKPFENLAAVVLVIIIAVPFFLHLDKLPVRIWDEARLAMNAYEMNMNGNFLVTRFEGNPDMWNTKPPLVIWLQVFCIRIFGFTEMSLRLPVAMAGFLTCVLLICFSKKYWNNYLPGIVASLVLVTANGYIHIHASRTGDYDTPLTFFTTFFLLSFFLHAETKEKVYLHLAFAAIVLAVFTKSIQGLIFLPAIALYLVLSGNFKSVVLTRSFLLDAIISFMVIGSYYLLREHYNPGYVKAVWENELGGRYFETLEQNAFSKTYYLEQLYYFLFPLWFWFVPAGVLLGLLSDWKDKRFVFFISLAAIIYTLFISLSETKLEWYTVPLFPLLSFLVAVFFVRISVMIHARISNNAVRFTALAIVYLPVFAYGYFGIIHKVYNPVEYEWDKDLYPISYVLQEARYGKRSVDGYVICYEGYSTQLLCYVRALNEMGQKIDFRRQDSLIAEQRVLASEPNVKKAIEENYQVEIEGEYGNVRFYRIVGRIRETSLGANVR